MDVFCIAVEQWGSEYSKPSSRTFTGLVLRLLTDWFAPKNLDNTVIFVTIFFTGTKQVPSITDNNVPLQSGSVFYEHAKLTGAQYKHSYINIGHSNN